MKQCTTFVAIQRGLEMPGTCSGTLIIFEASPIIYRLFISGIYLWDVAEFSSWNEPEARSMMKILSPRVRNIIL